MKPICHHCFRHSIEDVLCFWWLLLFLFINSCQFGEMNGGKIDFYISQHKLGYAVVTNNPLLLIFLAHAMCPEALLCVTFI